jgi:hypothetical protein
MILTYIEPHHKDKVGSVPTSNRARHEKTLEHAGRNVSKQTNSSNGFLQAARKDLAADYDGMNQPLMAAKFRSEYAEVQNQPIATTGVGKR